MPDLWKNINNLIYTFFGVPKREEIINIDSRETKKVIRECYDKCDKLNKVGKKIMKWEKFQTIQRRNRYLNLPISITHI